MTRSDQRRRPPLPTNRPRSGLEGNSALIVFNQDGRVPGRPWVNFYFSTALWINASGARARWL